MSRWQWYTRRIRRFGDRLAPAVENLSLASLKHFKQEPALWIGAVGVVVTAVNGARVAGADGWTVAATVVIAVGGFVARANVSPVKDESTSWSEATWPDEPCIPCRRRRCLR